jgi:hypothetical protein
MDDGDPCTDDVCADGECIHVPISLRAGVHGGDCPGVCCDGECCEAGQTCCDDFCCPNGQECTPTSCCAPDEPDGTHYVPCPGEDRCCPEEYTCCGTVACCQECYPCDPSSGWCQLPCGGACPEPPVVLAGKMVPYTECPCASGIDPGHPGCTHRQECWREDEGPSLVSDGHQGPYLQGTVECLNCPPDCPSNPPGGVLQCSSGLQGCYTSTLSYQIAGNISADILLIKSSLQGTIGFSDGETMCLTGTCNVTAPPCQWVTTEHWIQIVTDRVAQMSHTWRFYDLFAAADNSACECAAISMLCAATGSSSASGSAGLGVHCETVAAGTCSGNR